MRCTLYLADYRLEELRGYGDGATAHVPIEGTVHGRCFAAQSVLPLPSAPGTIVVPVSWRGDRLGVLELRLPRPDDAELEDVEGAHVLGGLIAQTLLAAARVTDVYRVVRRGRSLTLSAEMQWDLLPGRSLHAGYAEVAGLLEPAYSVVGDAYDWAVDRSGLVAVMVDGAGAGLQAADNVVLTVAALRNARREGVDLAGMARMADQALYSRHGGALFSSAVLVRLDPAASILEVVTAGAGTVLHVGRRGVRTLDVDRDPPLGAEEDYPYRATTVPVHRGDRIVLLSDGLTDAQVKGVVYGASLSAMVHELRLLRAPEVVRTIVRGLRTFHDGEPQQDDAVVLCLDVSG
jgi:serine phosphatase RsbU (regulator of sigma subunit)